MEINMAMITENNCHCQKCGYSWLSRIPLKPKSCPSCKSYTWDKVKEVVSADRES